MSTPPSWLQTLSDWWHLLAPFALFLAALWKRRWLRRTMRTLWHTITGAESLGERLHALGELLNASLAEQRVHNETTLRELRQVRAELQPNGGSSLHDVVHAMAAAQRARDDRDAEPLFWTDGAGRVTHVNRSYLHLSGRSREELVGSGWINFVEPTDRPRVRERWLEAIREARDFDELFQVVDTHGVHHTVHARATRLLGSTGRLLGYYGELAPTVAK